MTDANPKETPDGNRSFGRKRGRPLRAGRRRLFEELLPKIAVPPPAAETPIDPVALFDESVSEVWLEIGFGSGEHLAWQAAHNPTIGLIGCEVYEAGVATLLSHIDRERLTNVRILHGDAVPLLDALPAGAIARAFVLFPDPWPKARHHKRRFLSDAGFDRLARVLRAGAELRIATDHVGYLRWILERLRGRTDFEWTARSSADWKTRPDDWPGTRYEAKAAREGRPGTYLRLRRAAKDSNPMRSDVGS